MVKKRQIYGQYGEVFFDEVVTSIKKRYQRAQKLNGQKWMKNAKMINFGIFD